MAWLDIASDRFDLTPLCAFLRIVPRLQYVQDSSDARSQCFAVFTMLPAHMHAARSLAGDDLELLVSGRRGFSRSVSLTTAAAQVSRRTMAFSLPNQRSISINLGASLSLQLLSNLTHRLIYTLWQGERTLKPSLMRSLSCPSPLLTRCLSAPHPR